MMNLPCIGERPRRRVGLLCRQLLAPFSTANSPEPLVDPAELNVRPLKPGPNGGGFGVEVLNLDLRRCDKETILEKLLPLVKEHKLIVVRGTDDGIEGLRMAEFSSWMSPIGGLYMNHQMHVKQPTPAVFRLSNDENEGVQGGGAASAEPQWHHDSMHMPVLPCFQVLHMPCSPAWGEGNTIATSGDPEREGQAAATWFARADASKLSPETRKKLLNFRSFNLPTGQQHPLINTESDTMNPPSMVGVLMVDDDGNLVRKLNKQELIHLIGKYRALLIKGEAFTLDDLGSPTDPDANDLTLLTKRLEAEALSEGSTSIYRHVYRPGDVVIQDNWSVAHRAPTSEEREHITGRRVLHRCLALSEGGGTGGA